jgi:hypothetical protein
MDEDRRPFFAAALAIPAADRRHDLLGFDDTLAVSPRALRKSANCC